MDSTMFAMFLFLPLGLVGLILYFLPTLIAASRNHPSVLGIFVVNFLLGWSVIGWVVALVWALSQPHVLPAPGYGVQGYSGPGYAPAPPAALLCSRCGSPIAPGAAFCGRCGAPI
jgi:hypothetical protein